MSGLLEILRCVSLAVAEFNSYLTSFIVVFDTALTRSSKFSSFSLANIEFGFSLCGLNVILDISAVMFSASVIAYSSSSLMDLNTAFLIFNLDNGVLLWPLELVVVIYNSV